MAVIVLKFGGSTLKNPDLIKSAAQRIACLKKQNHDIIVVVSAMGASTSNLLNMAYDISSKPCRREMDMLITAGERISMALFSIALQEEGCPAISFTGSQAGILTTNSHRGAEIKELKPLRVKEALEQGKIAVLAGFQGVSPETKEVTTLGRGGSDITAVAFAHHFQAKHCEILKDVDGVYSYDPKLLPQSRLLSHISSQSFSSMTFWGAQVLYYKAAQLAEEKKVSLIIRNAFNDSAGTKITHEKETSFQWLSISSHKQVWSVQKKIGFNEKSFFETCQKNQIPIPTILSKNENSLWLTIDQENQPQLSTLLIKTFDQIHIKSFSSVSLIANSTIQENHKKNILAQIDLYRKNIFDIQQTDNTLSFWIPSGAGDDFIQHLHLSLGLSTKLIKQ